MGILNMVRSPRYEERIDRSFDGTMSRRNPGGRRHH
jgi:hypothetical protein